MSFIEDEDEVNRWLEEGKPYSYMVEQYQTRYGKESSVAYWSKQRERRGIKRPLNPLVPWSIKMEHAFDREATMLRREARRRAGAPIEGHEGDELDAWLAELSEANAVVHYDPERGWMWVTRQSYDKDIIREP